MATNLRLQCNMEWRSASSTNVTFYATDGTLQWKYADYHRVVTAWAREQTDLKFWVPPD